MRLLRHGSLALVAALLCGAASAHAAVVGTLSCTGSTAVATFNVSAYTFGVTQTLNIGSQSTGAGAGKAQFQPLEVHASLAQFREFFLPAAEGRAFQTCTLTSTGAGKASVQFEFKLVAVKSLTVVGQNARTANQEAAAYTDIAFEYGSLDVKTSGGADDGGTDGGWSIVTNTPQTAGYDVGTNRQQ